MAQDQDVYTKVFGEDKQSNFVIQDLIVSGTCPVVLGDSIKVFPPMGSNVPKGIPRENFQTFTVIKTSYEPPPILKVEKYGGTVKYYTGVQPWTVSYKPAAMASRNADWMRSILNRARFRPPWTHRRAATPTTIWCRV